MFGGDYPTKPWVGLLSAFGVLAVLLVLAVARGSSERLRAAVAMTGGTLAVYVLVQNAIALSVTLGLATSDRVGDERDRLLGGLVLAVIGLAVAARVALALPAWSADEPADETRGRRDRVAAPGRLLLLALVLALPSLGAGAFTGNRPTLPFLSGDVTVLTAVGLVVSGVVAAGPLLLAAADRVSPRYATAGALLVAARVVVVPIWPDVFTNFYWTMLAIGVATGLLAVAVWPLLRAAIPEEPAPALAGVLVTIALLAATYGIALRSV